MTKFVFYGKEYTIKLKKSAYVNNDTLAVLAYIDVDGYEERFCDVTVNIEWLGASNTMAFIDESNCPGIGAWLERNHIAIPTGILGLSGFNSYMLYKFNESALAKMEELK